MFSVSNEFKSIIADLQASKRPNRKYEKEQIQEIAKALKSTVAQKSWQDLIPILCILDNTITLDRVFQEDLITTIRECDDTEVLVLALGVCRKQITEECHKRSERVPFEFLEELEKLLKNKNPEVLEWTLRLIEGLGSQSRYFKEQIQVVRPGILSFLNQHSKASQQIIDLLNRRWK